MGHVPKGDAVLPCTLVCTLYLQHRSPHKPRLRVAWIVVEHSCQIRQGGVELVHSLTQCSTQHQHFLRGLIETPTWRKCGFGVACVTRITGDAPQFDIALRQAYCQRLVTGLVAEPTLQ